MKLCNTSHFVIQPFLSLTHSITNSLFHYFAIKTNQLNNIDFFAWPQLNTKVTVLVPDLKEGHMTHQAARSDNNVRLPTDYKSIIGIH